MIIHAKIVMARGTHGKWTVNKMKPEEGVKIYCVMLGVVMRDGKTLLNYHSKAKYIIENETQALKLYSEYVQELRQYEKDGWTRGVAQMFHPAILRGGHLVAYKDPETETICRATFGYGEDDDAESK